MGIEKPEKSKSLRNAKRAAGAMSRALPGVAGGWEWYLPGHEGVAQGDIPF